MGPFRFWLDDVPPRIDLQLEDPLEFAKLARHANG
jgi:hypothetical protein